MRKMKVLSMMFFLGTFVALAASSARADIGDRDTFLTFSAPVQVPGTDLVPGRYEFKLIDPTYMPNVVAVFNSKGYIVDQFFAIPDYLNNPTSKAVVSFEHRMPGTPEAIKTLTYPGSLTGLQFLYPPVKVKE